MVHGLGHGGINLHLAFFIGFLFGAQTVPAHGGGHLDHLAVGWHHTQRHGFLVALLAQHRPTSSVTPLVFVNERLGRLQGNVVGLKRQIGKKGLRRARHIGLHEAQHAVHKISRRVIVRGHADLLAIFKPINLVGQIQIAPAGFPVVRAAVALHDGLVKATPIGQVVALFAHMPFARGIGAVAAVAQQGGHGHHLGVEHRQIARLAQVTARNGFAHIAHSIAMVVHPREQHGPGGRTRSADMEVGKAHALLGQGVQMGGGNLAAK